MPSSKVSFFPKADAAVLQSKYTPPSPTSRPTEIAPILDAENANRVIDCWSMDLAVAVYPTNADIWAPAIVPEKPQCLTDRYLFPILTRNERLRLTMLYYYTRGALEDRELVSRLQEKVHLARETVGWEFAIAGLLDHNSYTRMATVGLPLAVLPRRESTCAHTVNQPPGTVFTLNNMVEDWRFRESPHVDQGGLRAYAGVPLRFETEFGEHIAFGSLCVASNSQQETLSESQQMSLARLADWIVADIIHSARARRHRERRRMQELLSKAQKSCEKDAEFEGAVIEILHEVYPGAVIDIQTSSDGCIVLEGRDSIPTSELEQGLWEDVARFDHFVENLNHQDPTASHVVRIIAADCENVGVPTFLVVGSKDFRVVFDDVDSWFVHACAVLLRRGWQSRALKEALAAKETFLRGITHQLRTPIHGIIGSVELLAEELRSRHLISTLAQTPSPPVTPDVEKLDPYVYIRTIRNSANELITTVNSMIKLNRWAEIAQAERVVTLHHIADIETALLREIYIVMADINHAQPSIIFNHQLPLNCDNIVLDMRLLVDCILPVIVNAVQNTAGGVVAVTTAMADDYQSLIIDVEDTGCGICPSDQQRIFHAYEKIDAHTTGAGLGLTLASRLASLMNGSISLVSSNIGQGSHFQAVFRNIACACSFQRPEAPKAMFANLPSTFHRLKLDAKTSTYKLEAEPGNTPKPTSGVNRTNGLSLRFAETVPAGYLYPSARMLGDQFTKYLINSGYSESEGHRNGFLLMDYSSNLAQLHAQISQVGSEQVAICLVPESGCVIEFLGEQILRENNILYAKGPFASENLGKILEEADRVLAESALSKTTQEISPSDQATVLQASLLETENALQASPSMVPLPMGSYLHTHDATASPSALTMEKASADSLLDSAQNLTLEDIPSPIPRPESHLPMQQGSSSPMTSPGLIRQDSIQALRSNAPSPRILQPLKRSSKPMALLVDDNPINLRLLEMYCGRRGLPYRTAVDGQRASRIFSHHRLPSTDTECLPSAVSADLAPFELILMDLQMPICDGIDATRQIRLLEKEHGWTRSVILIVTGQDSPSDRLNAEQAGADGFLVKPVGPKALDAKIRDWFPDLGTGQHEVTFTT